MHSQPDPTETFGPDRLLALSDGMFAVALTLLILDIHLPEGPKEHLGAALVSIAPRLGIFVLSFAIVAYYWFIHHLIFLYVRSASRRLLWASLLFLLMIVILPFSAGVLGRYPLTPIALATFGLNIAACSLTLWLTWVLARRGGHVVNVAPEQRRYIDRRFAISPVLAIAAVAVSRFLPWVSLALFVAVPVSYALTSQPVSRRS